MNHLSAEDAAAHDFPEQWYDAASEDHFWMQWRARLMLEHLRRVGLEPTAGLAGFDIGCGHGAVQRQLAASTAWQIDGCDLNETALARNRGHGGRVLRYNIFERAPALQAHYDVVFILDVIEHIREPVGFLRTGAFYAKPGALMVVNVPALPALMSAYDEAVGHLRRYTKRSLRDALVAAGLEPVTIAYWGITMIPVLAVRKLLSARIKRENLVSRGFDPPGKLADKILRAAMGLELAVLPDMPCGTSLLALARAPRG